MSDPTKEKKGAGSSFWRLDDVADISTISDFQLDDNWTQLAKLRDLQPGEITVDDEEDNYLDAENPEWKDTSPGQKDAGETQVTIDWVPGSAEQQQLLTDLEAGTKTWWRAKYSNGASDVFYGYINSFGKTIQINEKMQRTIKIKNCAKPKLAEELLV